MKSEDLPQLARLTKDDRELVASDFLTWYRYWSWLMTHPVDVDMGVECGVKWGWIHIWTSSALAQLKRQSKSRENMLKLVQICWTSQNLTLQSSCSNLLKTFHSTWYLLSMCKNTKNLVQIEILIKRFSYWASLEKSTLYCKEILVGLWGNPRWAVRK